MTRKRIVFEWWKALLAGNTLTPRRGCLRVVERMTGERSETKEPHRCLTANVGDRLMLFGGEDIAIVGVRWIKLGPDRFFVERRTGAVNDGAVRVLRLCK